MSSPQSEKRALVWAAAASLAAVFWLVRPIGLGLLIGALLAFVMQPIYLRLSGRIGARWGAFVTVFATGLVAIVTLGGIGWLLVSRATVLGAELEAAVGPNGSVDNVVQRIGQTTARLGISPEDLREHIRTLASHGAGDAAQLAESLASVAVNAVIGMVFALLTMQLVLRHGDAAARTLRDVLPLRPEYTDGLIVELRRIGRATLLGNAFGAIIQGGLATIGYWITGVPDPIFCGVATAIAAMIPLVGTLLVIVPAAAALALTGHPTWAIAELGWGILVVNTSTDLLIRPRLVRGTAKIPMIVTLAALVGGVMVFGLQGLLIGPVVMALALAVLRLYATEARADREKEARQPGDSSTPTLGRFVAVPPAKNASG